MPPLDLKMAPRAAAIALTAAVLFTVAYWPALTVLVEKWLASEEYMHAFLVVPIIVYMVWQRRDTLSAAPRQGWTAGLLLLVAATPFYFFTLLAQVHSLLFMAMVLTILGVITYLGGLAAVKVLVMPLFLLLLLIPVPEQLLIQITFPLQLKVSQLSEVVINLFGVPLFREGNIMTIPDKRFEVVEACSGMRSMMTLITLAVIVGYFTLERLPSRLVLLAASVPTAIIMNVIRVVVMILLFHFYRLDLSQGLLHTLLGMGLFGFALALFFLIQAVLARWELKRQGR